MGTDPIEWFQGAADFPSLDASYGDQAALVASLPSPKGAVNSRDIKLATLHHRREALTR